MCFRYPDELKRVSLARAMMMNPELILADEPTTGLGKQTGTIILDYLRSYVQTGKTVIVSTHDEMVQKYGNKILEIENGRVTNGC